jgi:hypothetical protein
MTMPARTHPQSDPEHQSHRRDLQPCPGSDSTATVTRLFMPAELNVDDLAEAIRILLERDGHYAPRRPDPDLLSVAPRVSHVLEANREP